MLQREYFASCWADKNTSLNEALHKNHINVFNLAEVVRNRPHSNQDYHIDKRERSKMRHYRSTVEKIEKKNCGIRALESFHENHLLTSWRYSGQTRTATTGSINVVKHRTKPPQAIIAPVEKVLYQSGPRNSQLQKTEINETLKENMLKSAQSKWAVPIDFVLITITTINFIA